MKKIKYTRTTENLSFNITLYSKYKILGESETTDDMSQEIETSVSSIKSETSGRLDEVMSFNPHTPYIVGVNGVTKITDEVIEYTIDEVKYIYDKLSQTTIKLLSYTNTEYKNRNYIYTDKIGLNGKIKSLDNIKIERNNKSITDVLCKFRNIENVDDFSNIGNGFYKIFNQTTKQ